MLFAPPPQTRNPREPRGTDKFLEPEFFVLLGSSAGRSNRGARWPTVLMGEVDLRK